jgi:DHA3 family macrolide efflux protein-like MFS transporter
LSAAGAAAASALCGSFVDRISRRRVAATAEFSRIIPSAAIPLQAAAGSLRLWQLLLIAPMANGAQIISGVAYGALLPIVVPRDTLGRANGFWQSAQQVGAFVGAAAAGVMIPVLGSAQTLWVQVALRLATCAGLLSLVPSGGIARTVKDRASGGIREVAETWAFLRGQPRCCGSPSSRPFPAA